MEKEWRREIIRITLHKAYILKLRKRKWKWHCCGCFNMQWVNLALYTQTEWPKISFDKGFGMLKYWCFYLSFIPCSFGSLLGCYQLGLVLFYYYFVWFGALWCHNFFLVGYSNANYVLYFWNYIREFLRKPFSPAIGGYCYLIAVHYGL